MGRMVSVNGANGRQPLDEVAQVPLLNERSWLGTNE